MSVEYLDRWLGAIFALNPDRLRPDVLKLLVTVGLRGLDFTIGGKYCNVIEFAGSEYSDM